MYVYPFCSLILNFEGADGSTTINDSGRYSNTFTANGNARIRTSDFKVGASSLYLDGTGDYVTGTSSLGPFFDSAFAYKVVTMESWVRIKADPGADAQLFGYWRTTGNVRWVQIAISSTRQVMIKTSSNGTAITTSSSGVTLASDTWTHVRAIVYGASSTARYVSLYVDGVLVYTTPMLTIADQSAARFQIGGDDAGGSVMSESYYDGVIVQNGWITSAPATVGVDNSSWPLKGKRRVTPKRKFTLGSQLGLSRQTQAPDLDIRAQPYIVILVPGRAPTAGPAPTASITGTVTELGIPVQRTIRAYRRDTGAYVSEAVSNPTTGVYTISVYAGVEHNLVCLDDAAGTTQNDLIKRKTAT